MLVRGKGRSSVTSLRGGGLVGGLLAFLPRSQIWAAEAAAVLDRN